MRKFYAQPGTIPQFNNPATPYMGANYQSMNPWAVQEQREREYKQYSSAMSSNRELTKQVLRLRGYSDPEIDQMIPPEVPWSDLQGYEEYQREVYFDHMVSQCLASPPTPNRMDRYHDAMAAQREETEKRYNSAKTKADHYKILSEIAMEQYIKANSQRSRNLTGGYDRVTYQALLRGERNPMLYDSLTTDDLEVVLPSDLSRNYTESRTRFLNRVFGVTET